MNMESAEGGIKLDDGELDNVAGGAGGPNQYEVREVPGNSDEANDLRRRMCPYRKVVLMDHLPLNGDDVNGYECPICGIRWMIRN